MDPKLDLDKERPWRRINTGWGLKLTMEGKLQNKTDNYGNRITLSPGCLTLAQKRKGRGLNYLPAPAQVRLTQIDLHSQVW